MKLFKKSKVDKKEKMLSKMKKKESTKENIYKTKNRMKKRMKNSQSIINLKKVNEDGLIELKTGEFAYMFEVSAVDLSLTSNQEKMNFYNSLKLLYQIKDLSLRCYKLDKTINLNHNKDYLLKEIEKYQDDPVKCELLENARNLIINMEIDRETISSSYYFVIINRSKDLLKKQYNEVDNILYNLKPKISFDFISNRLEIFSIMSNLYLCSNTLEQLIWTEMPSLFAPMNAKEKTNMLVFDDKEFQMVTMKNIPPFIEELFFEGAFNMPGVRSCITVNNSLTQEELIRWVNSQFSFALADRKGTKKLSDATDLDIQTENFQILMNDIKSGDEKIKEVSLIFAVEGNQKDRESKIMELKSIVNNYKIKLDVPRLRQMEVWQSYDLGTTPLKDYSVYLPTLTIGASFPFTRTYFNDYSGYLLGVDINTSLPIFFDPFTLNSIRTSHNIAVVGSTGSGKSYTLKKLIVDEYGRGTKIIIFDIENEYKDLVEAHGEYIDLYSKKNGIINPLQIRYIPSDDYSKDEGPLAKHLGFLEMFFKTTFDEMSEKERIMLSEIVESLYNKFGITSKTSIEDLEKLTPRDYPIFSDLYDYLPNYKKTLKSEIKRNIIDQLEISISRYLTGTDAYLFNGYTSIDLNSDLIAFNLQELIGSKNYRLINTQIMNVLTYLNNTIVTNKIKNDTSTIKDRKHIMIIADEFHSFCDEKYLEILKTFGQLARRIRKYSGSLVVASQSIKDFVGNKQVQADATAIFNNCQYQLIGGLEEDDLNAYIELFKQNPLTDTQIRYLSELHQGDFLLNVGNKNRLRINIIATKLERDLMGEK